MSAPVGFHFTDKQIEVRRHTKTSCSQRPGPDRELWEIQRGSRWPAPGAPWGEPKVGSLDAGGQRRHEGKSHV